MHSEKNVGTTSAYKEREEYSLSQLRIRVSLGRAYKTGSHPYHGRQVADYGYEELYHTDAGDLPPDEWRVLALAAVKREGKEALLLQIMEYCSSHCAWLKKEEDVESYALDCLASEAYLHWKDFAGSLPK